MTGRLGEGRIRRGSLEALDEIWAFAPPTERPRAARTVADPPDWNSGSWVMHAPLVHWMIEWRRSRPGVDPLL